MKNEEHPFGRLENHALLKEMNLSGINYETENVVFAFWQAFCSEKI